MLAMDIQYGVCLLFILFAQYLYVKLWMCGSQKT